MTRATHCSEGETGHNVLMEGITGDTLRSETVSSKLHRIAEQARRYPERVFTTLAHLMDVDFLGEAFRRIRKDAAAGVDEVTAKEYAENLERNLTDLHERLRTNRYRATPVERVWIDKEDNKKRPIGIPVLEDKIVQRAEEMLMSAVYEQDFYDFSHGFRKDHSPLQAVKELREMCCNLNIGWIVDLDVTGFFDNINRRLLVDFIKQRINDGGLIRLLGKWFNAGVIEEGELYHPTKGTPQGGVISPLLGNIFLHHVLDDWFVKEIKPRMKGRCFLIRFADDAVLGFEYESDARRVMKVLPKRFERFDLTIHPEKTALVDFRRPNPRKGLEVSKSTFDFLGFTHFWAKSRRGYWVIKRKTMRKRLRRTMDSLWKWCRNNRHMRIKEQYKILCSKLHGHYNYYGIRSNYRKLQSVYEHVKRAWRHWLGRRTRNGYISYEKFDQILEVYKLPTPRIVHSI